MDQLRRGLRLRRRAAGRRGGFTLLEVTIAMGILAVGLLAIAAMQIQAMRGGQNGRHVTQASAIARTQLEAFQRMDFASPQLAQTAGWSAPLLINRVVQANPVNHVEQTYSVQWRITDLNPAPTLKSIDVQVSWAEQNRPNRTVTYSTLHFGN